MPKLILEAFCKGRFVGFNIRARFTPSPATAGLGIERLRIGAQAAILGGSWAPEHGVISPMTWVMIMDTLPIIIYNSTYNYP